MLRLCRSGYSIGPHATRPLMASVRLTLSKFRRNKRERMCLCCTLRLLFYKHTHLLPDPRMSRLRRHNTSPSLQPLVTPSPSHHQIVPAKERSPSANPPSSSLLPHTCMHPSRRPLPPSISSATSTRTTSSPHTNPVVGTPSSGRPLSGRTHSSAMSKPTECSARSARNGCS